MGHARARALAKKDGYATFESSYPCKALRGFPDWDMSPAGSKNAPEAKAREKIDDLLTEAGWVVQDRDDMNITAGDGVAVREFKLERGHGYVDYLLFVDGAAVGVVEAK